jgi:hypothetical protein
MIFAHFQVNAFDRYRVQTAPAHLRGIHKSPP